MTKPKPEQAIKGAEFKKLRKSAGLTQWKLAIKIGVTQSDISIWEAGYRAIPEYAIEELRGMVE